MGFDIIAEDWHPDSQEAVALSVLTRTGFEEAGRDFGLFGVCQKSKRGKVWAHGVSVEESFERGKFGASPNAMHYSKTTLDESLTN
jgi:hypothetical protein